MRLLRPLKYPRPYRLKEPSPLYEQYRLAGAIFLHVLSNGLLILHGLQPVTEAAPLFSSGRGPVGAAVYVYVRAGDIFGFAGT